jgi:hypothetical protein
LNPLPRHYLSDIAFSPAPLTASRLIRVTSFGGTGIDLRGGIQFWIIEVRPAFHPYLQVQALIDQRQSHVALAHVTGTMSILVMPRLTADLATVLVHAEKAIFGALVEQSLHRRDSHQAARTGASGR